MLFFYMKFPDPRQHLTVTIVLCTHKELWVWIEREVGGEDDSADNRDVSLLQLHKEII